MMILGIDLGMHGGLAVLSKENGLWIEPMPTCDDGIDVKEFTRLVKGFADDEPVTAYMEKVHAVPKNGAHSMLTFGRGCGLVEGALSCIGVPVVKIPPRQWMKSLHDLSQVGNTKVRSLDAFRRIFPGIDAKVPNGRTHHMGMMEAALIAEYGRRTMGL